jgi:SAM-dependent methyltransferase
MSDARVRVAGDRVSVPSELHFLMAGTSRIAVVGRRGSFYIWPYDHNFIGGHLELAVRAKFGRARNVAVCDLVELRSDVAVYRARAAHLPALPPAGEYGVVNKVTNFLLMPVAPASHDDAHGAERLWEGLEGYHEHLSHEQQRESAHRISSWFADQVMRPLAASSFLELGCGSGRNLAHIAKTLPEAEIFGIDVNPRAVELARSALGERARILKGSLYELHEFATASIDVAFSMGVLMHVAHDRVAGVVAEMRRIARVATVHLECHGPSRGFDHHKYPRNYEELYRQAGLAPNVSYEIYQHDDFRTRDSRPFHMALLIARK